MYYSIVLRTALRQKAELLVWSDRDIFRMNCLPLATIYYKNLL